VQACITFGFQITDDVAAVHSIERFPYGMCISFAGMMCTMFEPMKRQRAGARSNASNHDKVLTYHFGLVAHVVLSLDAGKKLSDYDLHMNLRKDGFNQTKAYNKLVEAVESKADK
jgi:hypothetical protein